MNYRHFLLAFFLSFAAPLQSAEKAVDEGDDPLWQLNELARSPNSPIKFNADFNEYQLRHEYKTGGKTIEEIRRLRFCPFTGRRLPESTRSLHFTKPAPDDLAKYTTLLQGAKTLDDVQKRLGTPSTKFGPTPTFQEQYTYDSLPGTVVVIVQADEKGKISVAFYGKPKKEKLENSDDPKTATTKPKR